MKKTIGISIMLAMLFLTACNKPNNNYQLIDNSNLNSVDNSTASAFCMTEFLNYYKHDKYLIGIAETAVSIKDADENIVNFANCEIEGNRTRMVGSMDTDSYFNVGDKIIVCYVEGADGKKYIKSRKKIDENDTHNCFENTFYQMEKTLSTLTEAEVVTVEDAFEVFFDKSPYDKECYDYIYTPYGDCYLKDNITGNYIVIVTNPYAELENVNEINNYKFTVIVKSSTGANVEVYDVYLNGDVIKK